MKYNEKYDYCYTNEFNCISVVDVVVVDSVVVLCCCCISIHYFTNTNLGTYIELSKLPTELSIFKWTKQQQLINNNNKRNVIQFIGITIIIFLIAIHFGTCKSLMTAAGSGSLDLLSNFLSTKKAKIEGWDLSMSL